MSPLEPSNRAMMEVKVRHGFPQMQQWKKMSEEIIGVNEEMLLGIGKAGFFQKVLMFI